MPTLVGIQTTPSENKSTKIEREKGNLPIRVAITYNVTVSVITGKGKCSVKVGSHIHTNMISQPAVVRRPQM